MIPTAELLEAIGGLVVGAGATLFVVRRRRGRGPQVEQHVAERALVATEESEFRKILVPTLGTIFSDRMVSLACKLARPDEAEVEVLYVIEIPLSLPSTAELPDEVTKAGEALTEAEVIGRAHGVRVRGRVAKARFAGKSIVDVAEREGVELIILAAPPRKRFGEWGRTIDYVFRHAPCDVILERAGPDRVKTMPGGSP